MRKKILSVIVAIAISSFFSTSYAKITTNSDLTEAIKLYKTGNYAECYLKLDTAIKKDPSNPLGYYYKAMTAAQVGRKAEAIENYDKTLSLASSRSNLVRYAEKGKRCLETPETCREPKFSDSYDEFVRGKVPSGFSDEARSMFERLKIEQMMRDMNRNDDINPQKFKEYKDFSTMNSPAGVPSNDEIAAAVRTLQNAGLLNFGVNSGTNYYSDLSLLTGSNDNLNDMSGLTNMDPRIIQAMMSGGMAFGF